ncbi:MAG: hypothetical protein OXC60_18405 [Litoreibacter sp.]|nr:hypothetical protein [Litoreibacter sp.]MCY4336632.1 hypothetical protein [Litoreibacter sp.]
MNYNSAIAAGFAAILLSAPLSAQTSAAELFAMDNDSAAETLVREHSHGDVSAARVKLALDSMSPAERRAYFNHSHGVRMTVLSCMEGDSGDSAAESAARHCLDKH